MKRSRNVSLSAPISTRKRAFFLAPLAVASAVALSGCDQAYTSIAECEAKNGSGACMQEPAPTMMTEENRPAYVVADDCMNDFGEEHCKEEEHNGRRVYRPVYTYGQTYFYPEGSGGRGYYRSSITQGPGPYKFVSRFGFGGGGRAFGGTASA